MKTQSKSVGAVERERERERERGVLEARKLLFVVCKNNEYRGKFYTLIV